MRSLHKLHYVFTLNESFGADLLSIICFVRCLPSLRSTINTRVTATDSELHIIARSQIEETHTVLELLKYVLERLIYSILLRALCFIVQQHKFMVETSRTLFVIDILTI